MIELKPLQGQVRYLVEDLRGQVTREARLRAELRQEHADAGRAERIGGGFETWLENVLDEAAVGWVLGCVFVRFCEDNRLAEPLWLGGPEPEASADQAVRNRQAYVTANPRHNDRHWLREAFTYLRGLRATGKIFNGHNPVWRFDISGEAAEALSDFFRRGAGYRSLRTPTFETRFLGDLYQYLSAHARSTYALLQTPEFVEEFILDRTFEPAVREFGLANTSVIDPTCGSGHFLLGAFHRLVDKWKEREPAEEIRVLTERALGQVTGVDINSFAVAIARFRLLVAALRVCGLSSLERAPAFPVRVATGDSLLNWGPTSSHQGDLVALAEERPAFAYFSEDGDLLKEYLKENTYTVVVGNPPYITVKDKVLNDRYRREYSACSGQYALTVPFAQRFFALAKRGDHDGDRAGWVGQITANSFMKREFGKKLINEYFRHQVELSEVIDTSGAHIPHHGTPTVILVGRNRIVSERYSGAIRAVLGKRGEPTELEGLVWTAIVDQIDKPGSESQFVTSTELPRTQLSTYPWSLSGGGAVELLESVHKISSSTLAQVVDVIGFYAITGEDEAYLLDRATAARRGDIPVRPMTAGEEVRDFGILSRTLAVWPYDEDLRAIGDLPSAVLRFLWPSRRLLRDRKRFGTVVDSIQGFVWSEYREFYSARISRPLSITFADIATHNHFVLVRGEKAFNRTAPVIKMLENTSEDDHLRLLGTLSSSTACFWLKQVCFPKGGSGIGRGIQPEAWMERYALNASNVERFPLPHEYPLELVRRIDGLAQRLSGVTPAAVAASGVPTRLRLAAAKDEWHSIRAMMIALQEELDWQVYQHYGLLDEDLSTPDPPSLSLGERAFEIVLARNNTETEWFTRHRSKRITKLPDWPDDYRALVEKRIAIIGSDRNIALIERPECKRRWATEGFESLQSKALRDWLLDRLEAPELWGGAPAPLSVAQFADRVRHDDDFRLVLDLWVGHDQHDLMATLGRLVADEHVPYLPANRYKPTGLRKRAQWERTWRKQRREDAGERLEIEVPPKYTSADFARPSYWRNRGKLDVPKERFISYPQIGRDGDGTELLGWAGWDHLAQAQALATVYLDRKTQQLWPADRLLPLLAGLAELEPWLYQWYAEPRPGFPGSPAAFFTGLVDTELSQLGSDRLALRKLRGVEELE